MLPPLAATFLAFHPHDNNLIAIGMEDSSIQIYGVQVDELKGHNKRITDLAFSDVLNVLVSSGADSQLCVWNLSGWEKQRSKQLKIPAGRVSSTLTETRVQFYKDQTHLLAVHETQIAVYEAPKLESPNQSVYVGFEDGSVGILALPTLMLRCRISLTVYFPNNPNQSVYVGFEDGSVGILALPTLTLRCRISSTVYFPNDPNVKVHPLVIVAHLREADQFALGLNDGDLNPDVVKNCKFFVTE
nr:hypothetical protein [Tanacetum cinerariifolium]